MKTIVVPLDGSTLAEQILPYARALAGLTDSQLHLLQAVPDRHSDAPFAPAETTVHVPSERSRAMSDEHQTDVQEGLHKYAALYLASQAQALATSGAEVDSEVRFGAPADAILATAASKEAAFVAMATHGYSGLKRWTLGSVTDKVVHAASVPVLVVRSSDDAPPEALTFKHILLPLDGSALAQQALPLAAELAQRTGATITLLRAVAPPREIWTGTDLMAMPPLNYEEITKALCARAQHELEQVAEELRVQGLAVTTIVDVQHPAESIIAVAAQQQADLIVMATHGRNGVRRWALGSVADKVLHAVTTPLLLVRAQQT